MWTDLKRDFSFLFRVLIKPFYLENAGLLLTVFFISFGLFPSLQMMLEAHAGIMLAICTSTMAMIATFLLWTLYGLKTLSFIFRELKLPRNACLYTFGLGKPVSLIFLFFTLQLTLFVPVILYACLTVIVGIGSGNYLQTLCIVLFLATLNFVSAFLYAEQLKNPHREIKFPVLPPLFKRTWTEPFFLFPFTHFLKKRRMMLFVVKFISLFLLWGGFYLAYRQELEVRFVYIMMVGSVIAHSILVQHLRDFENKHMLWMMNLPISPLMRFSGYLALFAVILIPETVLLSKYTFSQIHIYDLPIFLILGITGISYLHSLLFLPNMNEATYMNYVFGSFLGLTVAVQFKIPILIISAMLLIAGYIIYKRRYYVYGV